MQLESLSLHNLRCFSRATCTFTRGVNLIYGANGSGKTSMVEALSLLSRGRSLSGSEARDFIRFDEDECIINLGFLHTARQTAGVSFNRKGERALQLNRAQQKSIRPLALLLPLLFITPQSFQLLEGSAKERRKFLDWLVFHVEPCFATAHTALLRSLAQRNALLKANGRGMEQWNQAFVEASETVNGLRKQVFDDLINYAQPHLKDSLQDKAVKITEHQGWNAQASLMEQLEKEYQQDLRRGHTGAGAHRYDLRFLVEDHKARQVLSRGEKKRMVLALFFAQIQVALDRGLQPVLVIDDLGSELDEEGVRNTIGTAASLCEQLIITSIEKPVSADHITSLFHV